MARKRKKIWKSEAERAAWEAHVDGTIANLRRLAAEGRAKLGIAEPQDSVTFIRELLAQDTRPPRLDRVARRAANPAVRGADAARRLALRARRDDVAAAALAGSFVPAGYPQNGHWRFRTRRCGTRRTMYAPLRGGRAASRRSRSRRR